MTFFLFFSYFKAVFFQLFIFFHSSLIFWPIFTFYMAIESYGHVDYTCFIHFEKSQKMKALGQKKCFQNPEPPNLELYPLIHSILPNILKLSNFQVSYHFGKLLSSWFQNFCPFCNILTEGYFTDHWTKKGHFFLITLYHHEFVNFFENIIFKLHFWILNDNTKLKDCR